MKQGASHAEPIAFPRCKCLRSDDPEKEVLVRAACSHWTRGHGCQVSLRRCTKYSGTYMRATTLANRGLLHFGVVG